jgi:hypothetical protein
MNKSNTNAAAIEIPITGIRTRFFGRVNDDPNRGVNLFYEI